MWIYIALVACVFGFSSEAPEESKIIGGVDAPDNYAPHMVSLFTINSFRTMQVCGGSIVSLRLVLTAAHCVTPFIQHEKLDSNFYGRVGSNIWHSGGTVITFKTYHIHPQWDEDQIKNDIALLVLKIKLWLNERVTVIGLHFGQVNGGQHCSVAGWGRTGPKQINNTVHLAPTPDQMQQMYLYTLSHKECVDSFSPEQASIAPAISEALEICTFHSVGHGMCSGDSGSPLVLQTARSSSRCAHLQVGIVSWGFPCAVGAPDVYTRISGFKEFIEYVFRLYNERNYCTI